MFGLDASTIVGILAGIATLLSVLFAGRHNIRKDRLEQEAARLEKEKAEAEASARVIELVKQESETRVNIVKLQMEESIANIKAEYKEEIKEILKQMEELRDELDCYRCYEAPVCPNRVIIKKEKKI